MIGIVGLGLIGGSLAKALKAKYRNTRIVAYDVNQTELEKAYSEHIIDVAAKSLDEDFLTCNLIFLCTPVTVVPSILKNLLPNIQDECILVDTGSTKCDIMKIFEDHKLQKRFVGGHPMAGSERSGFSASRANLFENAFFVLTPFQETSSVVLENIKKVLSDTGAIPVVLSAADHDWATAMISHMPHVIASLLVDVVCHTDNSTNILHRLAAGGFKDITRIASSSANLWTGISLSNKQQVIQALSLVRDRIEKFQHLLAVDDKQAIHEIFQSASEYRDSFTTVSSSQQAGFPEITVDVEDKPGIIARISTILADEDVNIKNIGINNVREEGENALLIRFESLEECETASAALAREGYGVSFRK